jgi:uncharacterized membrane protein
LAAGETAGQADTTYDNDRQKVDSVTELPRPGVGDCYRRGWQQLRKHFWILLGITIILLVMGSLAGADQDPGHDSGSLLAWAYQILFFGPLSYGGYFVFLKAARDERPEFADLFQGFRDYGNVVIVNFLVWMIIGIGFLLLIVPGVVLACRLVLTPYLVVDRKMRALAAIGHSWRQTRGHAWTAFFIGLLAVPIVIAGLLLLGVGVVVSIMWISLAFASLYVGVQNASARDHAASPGAA